MCYQYQKIKSVAAQGLCYSYIPCGKCEDCRNASRSSWEFRFRAEVEEYVYKKNWQFGFITLTYNEQSMPYIPHSCFKDWDKESSAPSWMPVPCFDKEHVRFLIKGLRKWLHKEYGEKRLIYLVCSEYGSVTKRPHYHAGFVFPPSVPAQKFYNAIRDLWCAEENEIEQPRLVKGNERVLNLSKMRKNLGFVCPRTCNGYGREKPFIVPKGNASAGAKYIAKYACKDVNYLADLPYDLLDFSKPSLITELGENQYVFKTQRLSKLDRYLPFHMQTRSLGFGILAEKSNAELLELYKNGLHFTGSKNARPQPVPTYIKNKILFTPYYIVQSDGRRLVRRQASLWFKENVVEVLNKKVDFYEKLIEKISDRNYFIGCGCSNQQASKWSKEVKDLTNGVSFKELALWQILYYGVDEKYCYDNIQAETIYLNRFYPDDKIGGYKYVTTLPHEAYKYIQGVWSLLFGILQFTIKRDKTYEEKLIEMVADYHKHADDSVFEDSGYIKDDYDYGF